MKRAFWFFIGVMVFTFTYFVCEAITVKDPISDQYDQIMENIFDIIQKNDIEKRVFNGNIEYIIRSGKSYIKIYQGKKDQNDVVAILKSEGVDGHISIYSKTLLKKVEEEYFNQTVMYILKR